MPGGGYLRDTDEEESTSSYDSDEEAAQGLAPGSAAVIMDHAEHIPIDAREPIYDAEGMHEKLEDIGWSEQAPWLATMAVTSAEPTAVENADDDLQRELAFYQQGLSAALQGIEKLDGAGVKWKRPPDYYAEMVKSDAHMSKVKDQLMYQQKQIEAAEERRKQRESKKFQKQVQAERLKAKAQAKNKAITDVTKLRKQRQKSGYEGEMDYESYFDRVDGKLPGAAPKKGASKGKMRAGEKPQAGQKRQYKNQKFGFGGKKSDSKRNDAFSAADTSGFKGFQKDSFPGKKGKPMGGGKHMGVKGGMVGKKGGQRPGKGKRAGMKGKR